jgi:Rod binding domain-containing protein
MSVSPILSSATPATARAEALAPAARANAAKLKGAALRDASPAEQRAAVSSQFEAIMVRQLLGKTMTSMLGGANGGVAGSVYGDMLSETMAQQLTAGQGLGLGRMLEQQLTPRGTPAPATPNDETGPAGVKS